MIAVVPLSAEEEDLTVHSPLSLCASWFTRAAFEPNCALCKIGCCVQRVSIDLDNSSCIAVHGVLGAA